jgi:rRNA maturation RNase YbeY
MARSGLVLSKTIRGPVPALPFEKMARKILGARYELSLVICGDLLARRMNTTYRKKTYSPNVLSFPLSENEGEIFLNVRKADREAKCFGTTFPDRIALLFVHGCFHLKGLRHGRIMESEEQRILRAFRSHAKKDLHGN